MADQESPALDAVLERIVVPEPSSAPIPSDVTGALADLLSWWRAVGGDSAPVVADIVADGALDSADAVAWGLAAADRAIDAGATLVVPRVATRDDVAARAIVALLTRKEASAVVAQPAGMSDRDWMALCARVRDAAAEAVAYRGQPVALLDRLQAPRIAAVVGILLGAAARRTPALVDGTDELAAALAADRLCFRAKGWWRAGSDSPDPGRAAAADRIDLAAGLPLGLTDDAGRGARASLAMLEQLSRPQPTG